MIEEIKSKLQSGYYLDHKLTKEEYYYLTRSTDLQSFFIKTFVDGKVTIDTIELDMWFVHLTNELSPEDKDKCIKNLLTQYLNEHFVLETIENIINAFDLTEEEKELYRDFSYDYIENNKDKITLAYCEENIEDILNSKQYDLLYKIEKDRFYYISEELVERTKKELKEAGLPFPNFFNMFDEIENYSLKTIFRKDIDAIEEKDYERVKNRLLELLKNDNNYSFLQDEAMIEYFTTDYFLLSNANFLNSFNDEELLSLLDKGIFNDSILGLIINRNLLNREEILQKFVSNIDNCHPDLLYKYARDFRFSFDSIHSIIPYTEEDFKRFKDVYIDNGIGVVIADAGLDAEQSKKVIRQILDGTSKIKKIPSFDYTAIYNDELLNSIIDNIKIDELAIYFGTNTSSFNNAVIKRVLINNNYDVSASIYFYDEKLFDELLKRKRYDDLVSIIKSLASEDEIDSRLIDWLKKQSDNTFLFHKLIDRMNYNPIFFDFVLGNDYITDEIMEKIIHTEKFELLTHDFYEKTKDYYSKKYNIESSKLDLLEGKFGTQILLYLDDDNIKNILRLDEEKIIKIINLFPEVEYSLVDVEAAYESIIQFAFGSKPDNSEIISIFPNILHAVNNKNEDQINKYINMLVIRLDIEDFEKIKEKLGIQNDMSPMAYIRFLIDNLDKDNNVDILHEITNSVILQERKFFRNNHYYMEKNNYDVFLLTQKHLRGSYEGYSISSLIKSISREDFLEVLKKFGIENIEDFAFDGSKKNYEIFSAVVENLVRIRLNMIREKNKIGYTIFDELGIGYDLDEKRKRNEIEKYYLKALSTPELMRLYDAVSKYDIDWDLTLKLIDCFKNESEYEKLTDEERKKFGILLKVGLKQVREDIKNNKDYVESEYLVQRLDEEKRILRLFRTSKSHNFLQILSGLNADLLEKNVFCDDETYNFLVELMKSKKIHMLESGFYSLISQMHLNLPEEAPSLAGFINFFKVIKEKSEDTIRVKKGVTEVTPEQLFTQLSIVQILNQANVYSAMSSIYSSILGLEDARIMKLNPGPNEARSIQSSERLKAAVKDMVTLYKRNEVTIPTCDKIVPLSNGKALDVIVGNFTAPCNLTHGERTGACMRIGGAGEMLYDFCKEDRRGFHIRFEDPKTRKYISRVSGFRNGNTVFLNQLRNSLSEDYTNEDLIEATKKIAEYLIESTKDSESPIENVFVTESYAVPITKKGGIRLDTSEVTKGLGRIYTDYSYSQAHLLATTAKEGYVPIRQKTKEVKYETQRSKPIIFRENIEEAPNHINRVHTVNQLIQGKTLEEDEIEVLDFKEDILYCIANDDWFIYVDKNLEIKSECMDVDPRAKEEFDKYKAIVEEMLQKGLVKESSHELL